MIICKDCRCFRPISVSDRYCGECCIGDTRNPIAINAEITGCCLFEPKPQKPQKPLTNGDRIRQMTDEELAYFLTTTSCSICCDHPLNCGFDCASLYTIKAKKTEQVSLIDRLAAEYDRKHPNGLKFTYSLDGEVQQNEQEEKENE